jgi:chemotaxis receptor (MCP) glutamine deamidase CheD
MSAPQREVAVAADRFEIVSDDAVLTAQLNSAIAVCVYDAVEEAGALLHLRFIVRHAKPAELTDTTLATELLLMDRCMESLRQAMPAAKHMQAKVAAHLPEDSEAQKGCYALLTLIKHYLEDSGIAVSPADALDGPARELRFRPAMGWLLLH